MMLKKIKVISQEKQISKKDIDEEKHSIGSRLF